MQLKTLESDSMLSPGAPLWIVADLEHSSTARKIDWYLNHQILRTEKRDRPVFSPELRGVMSQWDFEAPEIDAPEKAPLMIASASLLPNAQTVMIPFVSAESWAASCHRVWQSLNKPALRVFLPDQKHGLQSEDLVAAWPKDNQPDTLEVVPSPVN